ncbi:hypothetical protein Q3G72_002431 [Acer saccharum]|nr:hypothetical protein Q3G72_002431 [Acer saccharum]
MEGKCDIVKKHDLPSLDSPVIFDHIFFCENLYDPDKGAIKQLPANIKLNLLKERVVNDEIGKEVNKKRLATLDIFAGCGGLSDGLERAGVSLTKWAIEYEELAGEAFKLNHPEALMFVNNCNVILRAMMSACGDVDDCISTPEAAELAAASPEEQLPGWPEPMHVFASPELKVKLSEDTHYAAVRSTANGSPFRSITVRDTIGDLPAVGNGAYVTTMEYKNEPISWFQKKIRGDMLVLTDHISKEMNGVNVIRCRKIPKRPGADWCDLREEKGLFGRLDWEGNFPTSITDPQPMGKVGMCFHPDQDRIITVRECTRSQGFSDGYKFAGNIHKQHRQIGNAVPPPLAFALAWKLREALEAKLSIELE